MFRNIIILLICFVSLGSLTAQKLFTPQQEKEFAKLYMSQVNIMSPTAKKQYELLEQYKISFERYRIILEAEKNNNPVTLSDSETKFMSEVKNINQESIDLKALKVKEGIENSTLSLEDYKYLLERYKTDKKFALKIQEYFKS